MTRSTRQINTKSSRGRPKGSGKDDWSRLQQVAALIAANPALKPTTAIKRIGVTDPSVVRRLRDKFNLAQDDLLTTVRRTRASAPPRQTQKRVSEARAAPPAPAAESALKHQPEQPTPKAVEATCEPRAGAARTSTAVFGPFATLMGLGLRAAAVAVEQQYSLCQYALRSPPLEALVRQQLLITELMITATTPRRNLLLAQH